MRPVGAKISFRKTRARHAGQTVRFAIGVSALGRVLVAATDQGICAVKLGDNAADLKTGLEQEFPQANIEYDPDGLARWLRAVLSQLTERPRSAELPLDVRATDFQQLVWQALLQVPRGQVRSYAQIAVAIGRPNAVRAVARACAQNPVAVLVPCHRVIGAHGELTGYRWGLERKQQLLQLESALAPQPKRRK